MLPYLPVCKEISQTSDIKKKFIADIIDVKFGSVFLVAECYEVNRPTFLEKVLYVEFIKSITRRVR